VCYNKNNNSIIGGIIMFCQNCGSALQSGQAFCQSCGTPINQQPQHSQIPQQPMMNPSMGYPMTQPAPENKTAKTIISIVVGIFLLVIIIAIVTPLINSGMRTSTMRACCEDAGGIWSGSWSDGACIPDKTDTFNPRQARSCCLDVISGDVCNDVDWGLENGTNEPDSPNLDEIDPITPTTIAGTWTWLLNADYVLTFNANGSGTRGFPLMIEEFAWRTEDGRLYITTSIMIEEWNYSITGNRLTIDSRQIPGLAYTYIISN